MPSLPLPPLLRLSHALIFNRPGIIRHSPPYTLYTHVRLNKFIRLQLAETDKALRVLLALVRHGELCACGEGEELYRRPPRHVTRRVATPPHRRRSRRANLRVREMRNGGQERGDMEVTGKR